MGASASAVQGQKLIELRGIIHPPCACGAPWKAHDEKTEGDCGDYRAVPSPNCPDGVPVEVVMYREEKP